MGTAYIRADTGNNIANGNIIDATYLDAEFDAVQAAFHGSTGHTHDGTTGEGGPITLLGPAQDFIAGSADIHPKTTATYDLGTDTFKFRDGYFSRDVFISDDLVVTDDVTISGDASITGTLTVTGGISGTVTGGISGNAATATALQTSRTIGVGTAVTSTATSFNGSANITIPITAIDANYITSGTLSVNRLPTASDGANTWLRTLSSATYLTVGALGTFAFLKNNDLFTFAPGDLISGSSLRYSDGAGNGGGSVPSGTWTCLGRAPSGQATLFLRVD